MHPAALTIIRTRTRRLAKLIRADGTIEGYDHARSVDLFEYPVRHLISLHAVLRRMQHRPDCAIVRGSPIDLTRARGVRRLQFDDAETGYAATLRETPRSWVALDLDSIPAPASLDRLDLAACARVATAALPLAFTNKAAIVHATASHTFQPGIRIRLWFCLARPMGGAELKRWLANSPVDRSVFGTVQPIYTAGPVFAGRADPLPIRLALLPGDAEVQPPSAMSLIPPARPPARPIRVNTNTAAPYALAALQNAVARLLAAKDRHPAILAEARGLARLVEAGLLTGQVVGDALHQAAREIGKDDPGEIDKILEWAAMHPTGTTMEACHYAR
jgi:hypothetical protein